MFSSFKSNLSGEELISSAVLYFSQYFETSSKSISYGSLDLKDETLGQMDCVIASVHMNTSMGKEDMTQRVINVPVKAIRNWKGIIIKILTW